MSGDNVWILGTHMTKFGRHGDKDLIDLASESALGAMKDADVTIVDEVNDGGYEPEQHDVISKPSCTTN